VQRDTKEVLAELVEKLKEKLDPKKVAATSAGEKHQSGELRPSLDRLTVRRSGRRQNVTPDYNNLRSWRYNRLPS